MHTRRLGRTDISIAPIVFGGNVFGWTADSRQSGELIDRFLAAGFNAIDTADVYSAWANGNSGGESETVIGEWIASRKRREELVLMSKVGMWERHRGLREATIMAAVDDSLRRLNTDYLDVYFAHVDDTDTPFEETLGAFAKLKETGKVRAIGASNIEADRLAEALRVAEAEGLPRYEVLQPHYNLYTRDRFEGALADLAQKEGLGVVPYFSLASGFLTGKYGSRAEIEGTDREAMLGDYFDARGEAVVATLREVAAELGARPAQVALAWLLRKGPVTAPIASARTPEQLDETLGAVSLELDDAALHRLDAAGA